MTISSPTYHPVEAETVIDLSPIVALAVNLANLVAGLTPYKATLPVTARTFPPAATPLSIKTFSVLLSP